MSDLVCRREERREDVRRHPRLNGLDYLEVGPDRRTLSVFFLGKAPVALEPANIVIDGGRQVRDIRAERVTLRRPDLAELDDSMEVVTDREGDSSTYTLRIVTRDEHGRVERHPSFDVRYDRLDFSFKADCPSELDCKPTPECPPEPRDEPVIDYLAKDYASFRQLVFDRLALVMPDWRERHVPDVGVALVEVLAYVGDYLSYYQDAVATEAYLVTARQRASLRRHARLVDYALHEGSNARTWVSIGTDTRVILPADAYFVTRVRGLAVLAREEELRAIATGGYEAFEPMKSTPVTVYPGQHEMRLYTWGNAECCLPAGAREATLVGRWSGPGTPDTIEPCDPKTAETAPAPARTEADSGARLYLAPGDVLVFEEVIGPKTGAAADADRARRHAVRLTQVAHVVDPLHPERPLTGIWWAAEDALPFPLCLSAVGPPPECALITDVSVARGNIVLVDHGVTTAEDLDPVPVKSTIETCDCTGGPADVVTVAGRYGPLLKEVPVTWSEPLDDHRPASQMLAQDVRRALPQVRLVGTAPLSEPVAWWPRQDLLGSDATDRHFVVEVGSDGRARLRFGDGELGRRPDARTTFQATYRVGNGPAGNVGAAAVAHLITRKTSLSGGIFLVRNPLPARGGSAAEPLTEAKLYAPHAFRQRLERAIVPDDYAALVMREFAGLVQRAAASFRWNGSWHEVLVAVDALGADEADPALLTRIAARLYRYRRIGHDVVVRSARRVPLDLALLVCVKAGYLRAHVRAALLEALGNRRSADGRLGFFHPDRLSFGEGVYASAIVSAAQAVTGVESVAITRMNRLYEPPNGEIEAGVLPLGPLEIARLDNDPRAPDNGRLDLDLRGGR
jgi:hypothetical protein